MFIHDRIFISPQYTYPEIDLNILSPAGENKLLVKEPSYPGIPTSILRRMGKAVRLGVGSALPILQNHKSIDGILIGTGNGGMEDCIKFLNQVIEYEEGTLTPTNFVQSTTNAIASQLGMMSSNKGYNCTHVHRGLAFENTLLDVKMLLAENPSGKYLIGGVEEISSYQYNIEFLAGWFKKEACSVSELYSSHTEGCLAGEGSAMFLINDEAENSLCEIKDISFFETGNEEIVKERASSFLNKHSDMKISALLSGENGDIRFQKYFDRIEELTEKMPVLRYKHMTGDYPSVSSAAVWIACHLLTHKNIPDHMIKNVRPDHLENLLIYNNHKGNQHSLMLVGSSK